MSSRAGRDVDFRRRHVAKMHKPNDPENTPNATRRGDILPAGCVVTLVESKTQTVSEKLMEATDREKLTLQIENRVGWN